MSNAGELSSGSNIKWAGVRSSPYGIKPFPNPMDGSKR
jgi:hypothetical protein